MGCRIIIVRHAVVLIALAVSGPAWAQGDSKPTASSALLRDNGWPAGSIQEQLDRDATLVPFGKGAIFVPAMTNPLDEPPVSVWRAQRGQAEAATPGLESAFAPAQEKVAEGTTGRRIVVTPGTYRVEMGSGAGEQRFSKVVEVREMNVTVVPVTWAGLAVHMVDEGFGSVRGSYEVIRVDTREYVDVGFGADEQAGEPVATWILEPGLYKIVKVGETYRARRDFATVRLEQGRLTDFLLVVDEDTGDFQGAGEVPRAELFLAGRSAFAWSLVFGGDVSMSSRQNVFGATNGETFSFRAFLDARINAFVFDSPLLLQLQIEEGALVTGNLLGNQQDSVDFPWQKTQDRARLDGLYVYRLFDWLGPYLRFNAETNLFETLQYFPDPTRVVVYDENNEFRRARQVRENVRILPPVGLTTIKEGIGINLRVFKALFGETTLRVGIGGRHQITRQLIEPAPDLTPSAEEPNFADDIPLVRYRRVPSVQQVGVETTVVSTLRLTRWVLINVEVDTLLPFDDIRDVIIDIESTLAIKLTSFVSINYVFRYLRNPNLSPGEEVLDRFQNDLLLRFSLQLP